MDNSRAAQAWLKTVKNAMDKLTNLVPPEQLDGVMKQFVQQNEEMIRRINPESPLLDYLNDEPWRGDE